MMCWQKMYSDDWGGLCLCLYACDLYIFSATKKIDGYIYQLKIKLKKV